MSIHSTNAKAGPFIADGSQREFPYRFKVLDPLHIQVYINGVVVDGGYTVNESSVMMDVAPPAGANVVLLRKVPLTQEVDIQNNTAFYPEVLEGAYDKLTMITQQLAEQIARSIKVGVGETDTSPDALLNSIYASGNAAVKASAEAVEASAEAVEASAEAVEAAQTAKNMAEEITEYFGKTAGLPIGFTFSNPSAMPPEGAYLLNGQTIACGEELYRKFYEWVTTSPVRRITADEYEAEIAQYGICNGFVVSGTSVRLPLWKGYQTPLGDSVPVIGNGMAIGITDGSRTSGLAGFLQGATSSNLGTVVSLTGKTLGIANYEGWTQNAPSYSVGVATDPDKSGIIADTSGYPHDGFHWCIQVFNAATALSEQESAHLASEMQLKAQTDLGNVTNKLSNNFFDKIMPDYTAGVEISSGSIMPTHGVVSIRLRSQGGATVNLYINDVLVSIGISDTQYYAGVMAGEFMVSKNDVVRWHSDYTFSTDKATFYPLKGAN